MNLFELSLRLKGFPIHRAKKLLPVLRPRADERRMAIVEYHRKFNPLYRELTANNTYRCFEDLPIITKHDFQRPLEQIISDGYQLRELYVANTSGSSGHPFFYAKDKESHALTHATVLKLYSEHGITPSDKQARFYGIPAAGWSKYKERLKDFLCNRVRFPVFDLSDERLALYLEKFRRQNFIYVYGYTSAIVQFARFLSRRHTVLRESCPTLRCCITTSETCTSEDRALIEKAFGVKVVNEYGCSEVGIIAFEDPSGCWYMTDTDNYFEVVDDSGNVIPPGGGTGRILITSLSNKAMPFIRYEIGDLGRIEKIGDRYVLKNLSGRVSDLIKLPSGKTAAGLTFYYISRSVLEKHTVIREFIVRQTALDTFVFDIMADRDLSQSETAFLQSAVDAYLEPGLQLIINRVPHIERPASGKIKHFYSQL